MAGKMNKTNILFICKYNRFRSKVAEAYFKKISKNKRINVTSAGIIEVNKPFTPKEKNRKRYIKKIFNLKVNSNSRGINARLLESQERVIIVADDVPKQIFNNWRWKDKVEIWKIKDESGNNKENINKIVRAIQIKVKKLSKQLK